MNKQLVKDFIPPILERQLIKARIKTLDFKNHEILAKNKKFENIHQGEEVYIIGNGPSLKKFDLKKLRDKYVFVCNDFFLHPDIDYLNLKYYFNLDPKDLWFENVTKFINPKTLRNCNFFLPLRSYDKSHQELVGTVKDVYFISHYGELYHQYDRYLDLSRTTLAIINILQIFLVAANFMGFKAAYLLGFDMSWLAYQKKSEVEHFYETKDVSIIPVDEKNSYGRIAYNTYLLFNALALLNDLTEIQIYNSTRASFLDMFEWEDKC